VCEYCGCQDLPAIAALTREHDAIRDVARTAARAARDNDRRAAAVAARLLLELLRPHTAIEERGLFPAMAGEFGDHVASLMSDHRHLDEALASIADPGNTDEGWPQRLHSALADLFNHILREQDGLFPATLSVLTPQQWETLEQVRIDITLSSPTAAP
jgi:iron-sulfur cluster repair protein YtfE (RIC family)